MGDHDQDEDVEPEQVGRLAPTFVALLDGLGIEAAAAASVEGRHRLHYTFPTAAGAVAAVPANIAVAFADAFGATAVVEFKIGHHVDFTLTEGVEATAWDEFRSRAEGIAHRVQFIIEKLDLVQELAGGPLPAEVAVYLTTPAAEYALRRGLASIEQRVWEHTDQRLLIVLLDADCDRTGDCITVLGRPDRDRLRAAASEPSHSEEKLVRVTKLRARYVTWEHAWTRVFTPWHFRMRGTADEPVGRIIDACFVRLAVLYTCDRARAQEVDGAGAPLIVADFRGGAHVAAITINEAEEVPGATAERLSAVGDLVSWCYQFDAGEDTPDWAADRLPFIQTKVAQALEGRDERERLAGFVATMPDLHAGVTWHWKAFIEGRISDHLDRISNLEDAIAETVDKHADRAAELVESMNKTMLASVGVLIGTFIASAFSSKFNEDLFAFGMYTYAAYVLLFPLFAGLLSNNIQMGHAKATFQSKRKRFNEILYKDKVDEIVGQRVQSAENSYRHTMFVVGIVYVTLVVALVIGAGAVPNIVETLTTPTTPADAE